MRKWSLLLFAFFLSVIACGKKGTEPKGPDVPAIIDGPQAVDVGTNTARIIWKTDESSYSLVYYGTASGVYSDSVKKEEADTLHSVLLQGLNSNTRYFYRVESGNEAGKVQSEEHQFTTQMSFSDLVQAAWEAYENGDFRTAISRFLEIIELHAYWADAYNGLGWCYASPQIDSLNKAQNYFDQALAKKPSLVPAYAGRGFVHLALNQYNKAIADFKKVLELDANFVFEHDASVNVQDVRLGLAEAFFYRQQFSLAQEQVDILEPDNGLNPGDSSTWNVGGVQYPTYEAALLALIEYLKSKIG